MPINTEQILKQMLDEFKKIISDKWPEIRDTATDGLKKISENIAQIELMKANNTITLEQAQLQLDIQKNTLKTILITEKGLTLLAVESAINAALGIVKDAVNTAIGWTVL
ncbi:MAG TPA: hypothetical protein PKK00_09255 [Bacteroidales bacterium]|nr:hypothetical protein [Bacteroidales bacterium]HPS17059.1 hypothetical protein [Bacteroidales bacterium]